MTIAVNTADGPCTTGFEDLYLLNNSIPELDIDEIDLSMTFLGRQISYPIIINAITGGTDRALHFNKCLASLAARYNLPIAAGSANITIKEPESKASFEIIRQMNPQGLIFANIGAGETADKALKVIKLMNADALQLHFNVPQELAMREGERNFKNVLANVAEIVSGCPVPVIAKEVGFGFTRETVEKLYHCGVRIFDNSGKGGTNFIIIENHRAGRLDNEFENWGIPTAWSLAEIAALKLPITIIASGGIRTALEAVKALTMGANMVGIAAPFLKKYVNEGEESVELYLNSFIYRLKAAMLMTGAKNIKELTSKPLIIMNRTAEWLKAREIDPLIWAKRS
ncbi:MAG: type 2 isopentenyl-diphosphate Delta-isomerase [Syntrophomonadaceae bacterium]|jgi:isopentenyl-diphosphate delta-isomerase|nr:type 2 isopentenyl-diphosphate Delta-isomerase [Syntrophomonadaceae bacterium]